MASSRNLPNCEAFRGGVERRQMLDSGASEESHSEKSSGFAVDSTYNSAEQWLIKLTSRPIRGTGTPSSIIPKISKNLLFVRTL